MAGSHKETRRVDAGRNSDQSADAVGQTAGGKTKAELKKQDAEWGFEAGRSGMATEARMGMFIIVILVGAFGFLVYHKFDLRQRQLLAEMKSAADGDPDAAAQAAADEQAATFAEFQSGPDAQRDILAAQSPQLEEPSFDTGEPLEPLLPDEAPFDGQPAFADQTASADEQQFHRGTPLTETPQTPFDPATALAATDEPASAFDNLLEPTEPSLEPAAPLQAPLADADPFVAFDQQPPAEPFAPFDGAAPADSPPVMSDSVASSEAADLFPPVDAFPPVNQDPPPDAFPPVETFPPAGVPAGTPAATDRGADPFPVASDPPAFPAAADTTPDTLTPAPFPANTPTPAANGNPFTRTQVAQAQPATGDVPIDFMANVEPETVTPAEPVAFQNVATETGREELGPQQELTPLLPLEPVRDPGQLDPETAVAMLDPRPDVNLFEDPGRGPGRPSGRPSGPPATDPEADFPTAAEPEAPDFPGFDEAPRTFGGPPATQTFADSDTPAETITPPEPNLFAEPLTPSADPTASANEETVPAPHDPAPMPAGERVFGGIVPGTTRRQYDPPPRYEDEPIDVNAPGVGVAHIVPGASRIKLTAATEECAICEVQNKDNYWTISRRAYGTARYFSSLAEYNRDRIPDPRKLRPGMKVLVPDPKILEAKYPEFFKDQKRLEQRKLPSGFFLQQDGTPAYRVGPRETLGEISQKHLGRASRWIQIFRMNQRILQDPNKLKPGIVITLPDDATNVQIRP